AGSRWIRDAAGAQGVQIILVIATKLEILQTGAAAEGVVADVEHMVRVLVGNMDLQQLQPLVERFDQTETLRQQVDGSNAATGDRADLCRYFVMNIARRELRLKRHRPGRPRSCLLGLPQIRTCPIRAYGSSSHGFAAATVH